MIAKVNCLIAEKVAVRQDPTFILHGMHYANDTNTRMMKTLSYQVLCKKCKIALPYRGLFVYFVATNVLLPTYTGNIEESGQKSKKKNILEKF